MTSLSPWVLERMRLCQFYQTQQVCKLKMQQYKSTPNLDFEGHSLTKSLECFGYNADRTLEENVAIALIAIQEVAPMYESVPESAFQPHTSLFVSDHEEKGRSINIYNQSLQEADDDIEVQLFDYHTQIAITSVN